MHLHAGQFRQDVRHLFQLRPVVLDVLARGEVAVALVVLARDVREHAQLHRGKEAVGHGDAQHRRKALDVEPVAQAQRPELVFGELAREKAPRLVAKLRDALGDEGVVVGIVAIHRGRVGAESVGNVTNWRESIELIIASNIRTDLSHLKRSYRLAGQCAVATGLLVTNSEESTKHWSDQKADVVATLVVFVSLVIACVYFISNPA